MTNGEIRIKPEFRMTKSESPNRFGCTRRVIPNDEIRINTVNSKGFSGSSRILGKTIQIGTLMILIRAQYREIDRRCIEELSIHGVVLMENASRGVADAAG